MIFTCCMMTFFAQIRERKTKKIIEWGPDPLINKHVLLLTMSYKYARWQVVSVLSSQSNKSCIYFQ